MIVNIKGYWSPTTDKLSDADNKLFFIYRISASFSATYVHMHVKLHWNTCKFFTIQSTAVPLNKVQNNSSTGHLFMTSYKPQIRCGVAVVSVAYSLSRQGCIQKKILGEGGGGV